MRKRRAVLSFAICIVIAALSVYYILNIDLVQDTVRAQIYHGQMPEAIAQVEGKLELTGDGVRIFRASWPEFEGSDDFNAHCEPDDVDVPVLGCFAYNNIYIYGIEAGDELDGIRESTAAHELLHAAWQRLSEGDRARIGAMLMEVYDGDEYREMLMDEVEGYEESEKLNELHSRIGVEIADLPSELEAYYAKYFISRSKIVEFYEHYNGVFRALRKRRIELREEIEKSDEKIEASREVYERENEALMGDIDRFNACAKTLDCFSSDAEFTRERNALIERQNELDVMFENLNIMIRNHNNTIDEYNKNVVYGEKLNSIINSNAKKEEIMQ